MKGKKCLLALVVFFFFFLFVSLAPRTVPMGGDSYMFITLTVR